ncbi:hypothetical protein HanRHA438_Chr08g0342671 [Helianthus annuus]|nr:hypothetical protein HanRHA438_Chr08g0342671 [Helianthus annuus]
MHQQTPPLMLTKSSVSSLQNVNSSVFISLLALFKVSDINLNVSLSSLDQIS